MPSEPEGYVRTYIEEGPPMAKLLREAARRSIRKPYSCRLIAAIHQDELMPAHAAGADESVLVELLSEREMEVLKLLADGCTNREIGQRLYISLSTIKGHIANISGKLLARNRTKAVARARQLGLLPAG